jgi:hypothetical protein
VPPADGDHEGGVACVGQRARHLMVFFGAGLSLDDIS